MNLIAVVNGRHCCYTTTNGRDRHFLGCSHETPRQAIRHNAPAWAPATRAAHEDPNGTDSPPNRGAQASPRGLLGSPDALPSRTLGL